MHSFSYERWTFSYERWTFANGEEDQRPLTMARHEGAAEIELSRLSPGDYFGEGGLFTGSGEPGTIRAMTFAVVYEVGQAALAELMRDRPGVADEIAVTLSQRAKAGTSGATSNRGVAGAPAVFALVSRIRQLFS